MCCFWRGSQICAEKLQFLLWYMVSSLCGHCNVSFERTCWSFRPSDWRHILNVRTFRKVWEKLRKWGYVWKRTFLKSKEIFGNWEQKGGHVWKLTFRRNEVECFEKEDAVGHFGNIWKVRTLRKVQTFWWILSVWGQSFRIQVWRGFREVVDNGVCVIGCSFDGTMIYSTLCDLECRWPLICLRPQCWWKVRRLLPHQHPGQLHRLLPVPAAR